MKIKHVQLFPIATPRQTGIANQHVLVKIEAGDSYVGWGEMSDLSHVPMYQFDLPELERMLNQLLGGKDARNLAKIEDDLIRFYPDEGHMYSRSGLVRQGVDLALHDLIGRAEGVPVYDLLGGKLRDRMRVCYPIFRMRSVDEVAPNLQRVADKLTQGFDLIRVYVGANLAADELFLGQFTDRFKGQVEIKSLDFSNLLDWRRSAMALERFDELCDYMLVESGAPRNDIEGLAQLRRRTRRPSSEHVLHLHHGWQLLSAGAVDILNVSPYLLGGLRACERMIALAEAARASVLIGTTQELNLGTAAVAHLAAAARVLDYPGDSTGPHLYTDDAVKNPVRYEKSHLLVPEAPGLGLEVDEEKLKTMTAEAKWTFGVDLAGVLDRTAATRPSAQQG
ncbi:MAG TPA: enolase C-terminal domain-like protein [Caldilineaceae bacterium]|nr:enolase C-terminal domain-like protein [Caldilineaceae bacterium]